MVRNITDLEVNGNIISNVKLTSILINLSPVSPSINSFSPSLFVLSFLCRLINTASGQLTTDDPRSLDAFFQPLCADFTKNIHTALLKPVSPGHRRQP
jgi:hypothetical protein